MVTFEIFKPNDMENLILVIGVFVMAMSAIMANVFVLSKRDQEEYEHYMHDHPEKYYVHRHGA